MVACAGPTQAQARQNLSGDRGNGHDLPSRTKTLSPIGSCLQRKNQFSTIASHWYTNHTQEQSLCPTVCRQHKMNSAMSFFFCRLFLSHTALFGKFLSYWSFVCILLFPVLWFYEFGFCIWAFCIFVSLVLFHIFSLFGLFDVFICLFSKEIQR